jgi:hypothetical protein
MMMSEKGGEEVEEGGYSMTRDIDEKTEFVAELLVSLNSSIQ